MEQELHSGGEHWNEGAVEASVGLILISGTSGIQNSPQGWMWRTGYAEYKEDLFFGWGVVVWCALLLEIENTGLLSVGIKSD